MKKKFVQIALIAMAVMILLPFSFVLAEEEEDEYSGVGNNIIRIGIYYGNSGKQSINVNLRTGDGFKYGYYDNNNELVEIGSIECSSLKVSASSGVITVTDSEGKTFYESEEAVGIEPYSNSGEKTVATCGYPYYGGFRFELISGYGNLMTIVNMVKLDDYVKGVVPYEMSASWPIEALKAQAVCARTYALSHYSSSHKNTFHFDLCDSDDCQVYNGVYSGTYSAKVDQSVEETSGVVATYNGSYCELVYSSSNGGASESAVNVWGTDYPYLIGKEDPFEALISIPDYNWSVTYTGQELQSILIKAGRTDCGVIVEVSTTLSDTGNVIAITFIDDNGKSWTVYNTENGGNRCSTLLSLKSIRYTVTGDNSGAYDSQEEEWNINGEDIVTIEDGVSVIDGDGKITTITSGYVITANGVQEIRKTENSASERIVGNVFTFNGTGWGHNVGLSQYGAYSMALQGYSYDKILQFYYTGIVLGE